MSMKNYNDKVINKIIDHRIKLVKDKKEYAEVPAYVLSLIVVLLSIIIIFDIGLTVFILHPISGVMALIGWVILANIFKNLFPSKPLSILRKEIRKEINEEINLGIDPNKSIFERQAARHKITKDKIKKERKEFFEKWRIKELEPKSDEIFFREYREVEASTQREISITESSDELYYKKDIYNAYQREYGRRKRKEK